MGSISKESFRKLLLVYLIGKFEKGIFGNFKFQKVLYYALKESELRPFPYRRTGDGQFSQEAWNTLDELYEMGYIFDARNDPNRRIWRLADNISWDEYVEVFEKTASELAGNIKKSIEAYGKKTWRELREISHSDPVLETVIKYQLIFDETIGDEIEVDLSEDDCADLELSLNPQFVNSMTTLIDGIESGEIPLEQWRVES